MRPAPESDPAPASSSPDTAASAPSRPPLDGFHHILIETARQLGSSLEPQAIFTRLKDSVCRAMRCDGILVSSFDPADSTIRCTYGWVGGNVMDPSDFPTLTYRHDSKGMQSQVIRTGRPMLFTDVAERVRDPQGTYYEVEPSGALRDLKDGRGPLSRSAIMVPLRLEGEVVGVVQVMADAEAVYSAADLEVLEGISLLLAVALENARLYRLAREEIEERRRTERALRETEEALRDAGRRKDEFLATLGHELRNPLNPIRNAVEILRRKGTSEPDAQFSQDLIERQVVHLARLIDDLLDVSRITKGKLELRREPVDLAGILGASVESIRPFIERTGQTLRYTPPSRPIPLRADPVRLAQVFSNLLDNAAKYTKADGHIAVTVETRGPQVCVTVSDDGSGIAPEHLPHIFELFYQADRSLGRTHGGLGVGLTLVKRLVDMHGGSIEAASDGAGRGSRFTVLLPILSRIEAPAVSPPKPAEAPSRPLRILVADDNRDSVSSLAILLRYRGHQVWTAFDGEEAVFRTRETRPEILLLDIGMPRLSGYEVAQKVRAESWGRDMVLIATTGWGQDDDLRRSINTGFDAHLVKPIDPDVLFQTLAQFTAGKVPGTPGAVRR
jgi:signal transduction histidine kinase/CheY-like chemotaxis protein